MDSPTDRMPIACVTCAKAKAKCDKKVPCGRCCAKQIICQSRATRRSSHNANRRNGMPRPHPERALTTSTGSFHVSQLSQFSQTSDAPMISPSKLEASAWHTMHISDTQAAHMNHQNHHIPPVPPVPAPYVTRNMSMPNIHQPVHIAPLPYNAPDMDHQTIGSGFTHTPPEQIPITPMMANMPHMEPHIFMGGQDFDHNGDNQFLDMNGAQGMMDFDMNMNNPFPDFSSPQGMFTDQNGHFMSSPRKFMPTPTQMHVPLHDGSVNNGVKSGAAESFSNGTSPRSQDLHRPRTRPAISSLSPTMTNVSSNGGLLEPDAVLASEKSWPFFQCNKITSTSHQRLAPKTAHVYLEGLSQTLRDRKTWQAWQAQMDESGLEVTTERKILIEPMSQESREKLVAIIQIFLHKALEIHKNDRGASSARDVSPSSPASSTDAYLMLPPPEVVQYFLRSYSVRLEPYYPSIAGGRLDSNTLMAFHSSRAACLLILLMVASGATATPTVEARYIASGLTEACRLSLFDLIEKDVVMSRDPLVLRSALLFICLSAWSGDKWHMDMSMGQRGTYMAMLSHSGLLDKSEVQFGIEEVRRDPDKAWEEWKEHESKHRLAHAWVTLDQEISLFSDTTPLLALVNLLTPMPDSDDLWHAGSTAEWLEVFDRTHGSSYKDDVSLRDFFTSFVDGDFTGKTLSPMQLRLLLHPLQAQVCHLRQFIACLPDSGKASRSVSKAATKARLEEISAMLQQWYAIIKQSFSGDVGTCWTTCANLIMYHLISLNAITSFKDIEQFARREVELGPFRQAAWLQARCIDAPEEVFFHFGQVLRLIRSMPVSIRPLWWSGAIYRIALTAWATSMANAGNRFGSGASSASPGEMDRPFAIDDMTPENEAVVRYMKYQEGTPLLTRNDGSLAPLDVPSNILEHCIDVLEEDSTMRLAEGIKRKLKTFLVSWKDT